MKEIILKRITLLNFKGARELSIDFNQSLTNIFGRNGSGKTTVFDAFTWLLFGKDSQDRKKFDLKTIDNAGIIIPQIPHEVSAVITVNGEEIRLTRRFTEKWVKRAGQTDPVFTGNEEERFYNDVPCSAREYEAKIADICNETVFKFITSPTYFTAQSADAQKAMLSKMAGTISDSEIAAGNEDFEALLKEITGKTLDEYKKEISAKKSRLNAEIAGIPDRIDEKKRDLADEEDWSALESQREQKREERTGIEAQLEEASEAQRAADRKRLDATMQIGELRKKRVERINTLTDEARKGYYEQKQRRDEIKHQIQEYCKLRFTEEELAYLDSIEWIRGSYVDFLRLWQPRYEEFEITENADCGIAIEAKGTWLNTSMYEIPVLSIVNEVYFRMNYNYEELFASFKEKLQ